MSYSKDSKQEIVLSMFNLALTYKQTKVGYVLIL